MAAGDVDLLRKAICDLQKSIIKAKLKYAARLKDILSNNSCTYVEVNEATNRLERENKVSYVN